MWSRTRVIRGIGIGMLLVTGVWVLWWGTSRMRDHRVSPIGTPERYNIVWITLCSVRADHLSAYGYTRKTSPILEFIAQRGVRFRWNFAQAPWTLPSVSSMLSSRSVSELVFRTRKVSRNMVFHFPGVLPDDTLISEILQRHGYHTIAVVGGFVGEPTGFRQGWDVFHYVQGNLGKKFQLLFQEIRRSRRQPFFAFIFSNDAHYPYGRLHTPARHLFTRQTLDINISRKLIHAFYRGDRTLSREEKAYLIALYDEMLFWVDHHLWRLWRFLEQTGMLRRTIIVINADHGESFGEHGHIGHGRSYFNTEVRVPLVWYVPNLPRPGRVIRRAVQNLDIVPTLLDLVGIPPPIPLRGTSLRPYLFPGSGPPVPGQRRIFIEGAHAPIPGAIVRFPWKLILHGRERYLFQIVRDPRERHNLFRHRSDVATRLERFLITHIVASGLRRRLRIGADTEGPQLWMDRVIRGMNLRDHPEMLEQLRALGYIQ